MPRGERAASRATVLRIFRFVLIPVVFVTLGAVYLSIHYRRSVEAQTELRYAEQITLLATRLEALVSEVTRNLQLLETSPEVVSVFLHTGEFPSRQYTTLVTAAASLSAFAHTKTLIDMVYIYVRDGALVVSSAGSSRADNFFANLTSYADYDPRFWKALEWPSPDEARILAPTTFTNNVAEQSREVMPIVYRRMGRYYSRNLLVVHFSVSEIRALIREYLVTEGSDIAILDSAGRVLVSTDETREVGEIDTGRAGPPAVVLEPAVAVSPSLGLRYVAIVPRRVLNAEAMRVAAPVYALSLVGLLASVVAAYLLALRIHSPIRQLVGLLTTPADRSARGMDEYQYLRTKVGTLLDSERTLSDQIASVAPVVFEQHLVRLLNQDERSVPPELERFLDQHGLSFAHERFLVGVCDVDWRPTKGDSPEVLDLHAVLARLVVRAFEDSPEVDVRPLHLEPGRICLVFGMEDPGESDVARELGDRIGRIAGMVRADHPEVRLVSGLGRPHEGYPGMRRSYREALTALAGASGSGEAVRLYVEEEVGEAFVYTIDDEVRLTHHLVSGDREHTEEQIRGIVGANRGRPSASLRELYIQLVMTATRVLYAKGGSPARLLGPEYRALADLSREPDLTSLASYVRTLFDRVAGLAAQAPGKIGSRELVAYVNEHLSRPLYLDQLATVFHTTPKYISRYFRKAVGTPFYQYVENRRVQMACELLRSTTLGVSEVGERVGILNRNTFLRVFKKVTGLTPSAWREGKEQKRA